MSATSHLEYLCDDARHLVCWPYSVANLHAMAEDLGIKRCWFHRDHYDIPKRRVAEIREQCIQLPRRQIVRVIKGINIWK